MILNADLSLRVVLDTAALPWVASPEPGVERRLLARDGGEVARATSLVRYAPGARFAHHAHGLGEEFLVLEGEFCDEYGRYDAGTYVRNPAGSGHAPWSDTGCILFVKLRQLDPRDRGRVVARPQERRWQSGPATGLLVAPLAGFEAERTALLSLAAGDRGVVGQPGAGREIFVVTGSCADARDAYPAGTWLREPPGCAQPLSSPAGCTLLVKSGHLPAETRSGA